MSVRRRLFDIIQPDQGDSRGSRLFDWTITALILVCVAIAFVVSFDPPRELVNALLVVEQIASVASERARTASRTPNWIGSRRRTTSTTDCFGNTGNC